MDVVESPSGPVHAIAEDQQGRIWVGGEDGLTLFADAFRATFSRDNSELPDNRLQSLLVDRDNHLWVGTASGLARVDFVGERKISGLDGFVQDDGRPRTGASGTCRP